MSLLEIVLLGLALSADAFSVTISNTFAYRDERASRLALMPTFFGAFQALMPVAGYYLGGIAAELIESHAGIVTLVILGIIGGNMVREGVASIRACRNCEPPPAKGRLTLWTLFVQSIATAIDAFAVGVSLRAQAVDLAFSACTGVARWGLLPRCRSAFSERLATSRRSDFPSMARSHGARPPQGRGTPASCRKTDEPFGGRSPFLSI